MAVVSTILLSAACLLLCLPNGLSAFELTITDQAIIEQILPEQLLSATHFELFSEMPLEGTNPPQFHQYSIDDNIAKLSGRVIQLTDNTNQLTFRWRSAFSVDRSGLFYDLKPFTSWNIELGPNSNQQDVEPIFSIPGQGRVPRTESEFNIQLQCRPGVLGHRTATIELFVYSPDNPNSDTPPTRYTIYVTLAKICKEKPPAVEPCQEVRTRRGCRELCPKQLTQEQLARIYCNASFIIVGTFRKTKEIGRKCENRLALIRWRNKIVSWRNAFLREESKKFQVFVSNRYRKCKCLRRLKRDSRYIFVGERGPKTRSLRLSGSQPYVLRREGLAKTLLETVTCPQQ